MRADFARPTVASSHTASIATRMTAMSRGWRVDRHHEPIFLYALVAPNKFLIISFTKLAAERGVSADRKTVGSKHYFTDKVSARDFVPAFLGDPDFAYFTLSNGSAIKLTYNVAVGLPEEVSAISAATFYEVQDYNYQAICDIDENYVPCFAP